MVSCVRSGYLLFLWLCFICISSATAQNTLPLSVQVHSDPSYVISWGISPDNSTLLMQLELEAWCWVGVAIKPADNVGTTKGVAMSAGDFIVAEFAENGSITVSDRYCSCQSAEEPDLDTNQGGKDNILSFSGMQYLNSNGTQITLVLFERLLNTGDTLDNTIESGNMTLLYAFGQDTNTFSYHGDNAGSFVVDLLGGTVQPPPENTSNSLMLVYWHGCCMTIAFGFCMSIGVFFPRYLKSFWWWFPMHILIQITGVLLALTGFVIIFIKAEGSHMGYTHSWFGLITVGLSLATPLLGVAAHFMWNATRSRIPMFPDQLHWWFGRTTVVLSWVTIFLGMDLLGVPYQLLVAFAGVLLAYLTAYVWLDAMKIKEIGIRAYLFGAYTKKEPEPTLSDYY